MKKIVQAILQKLLGFERYLFLFSWFKIKTLKWDRNEGDFLHFLQLLKPEATVLDIGANIGIMTALLAQRCPQGKIYAFEPIPENFRAMQRIVSHFRSTNVTGRQIALGKQRKTLQMSMPVMKGVRMQGLTHVNHVSIEGYDTEHVTYEVQQETLDGMEALQRITIHAMKMDVENYEFFVLDGSKALIERNKPLIYCELWDNENRQQCFQLLSSIGYEIFVLISGNLISFDPHTHEHQNFFFIHPENKPAKLL